MAWFPMMIPASHEQQDFRGPETGRKKQEGMIRWNVSLDGLEYFPDRIADRALFRSLPQEDIAADRTKDDRPV